METGPQIYPLAISFTSGTYLNGWKGHIPEAKYRKSASAFFSSSGRENIAGSPCSPIPKRIRSERGVGMGQHTLALLGRRGNTDCRQIPSSVHADVHALLQARQHATDSVGNWDNNPAYDQTRHMAVCLSRCCTGWLFRSRVVEVKISMWAKEASANPDWASEHVEILPATLCLPVLTLSRLRVARLIGHRRRPVQCLQ